VSCTKIWLPLVGWLARKLLEAEANTTNSPVVLTDGPEFVNVNPSAPLVQLINPPQIPAFACVPSNA
jgi:hypothetical protein